MRKSKELSEKTKNKINKLYSDGYSREYISNILNVSEFYVRKTIGKNFRTASEGQKITQKRNSTPLTQNQLDMIYGSLLGDASLFRRSNGVFVFKVGHTKSQKPYLSHKAKILGNVKIHKRKHNKSSFSKNDQFELQYCNKYELEKIHKIISKNNKKIVSEQWLNEINEKSIAYWFMDDGTSSYSGGNRITASFSTNSFSKKELSILTKKLLEFGIETAIYRTNKKLHFYKKKLQYIICIKQKSINKFMNMIKPYVVPCMKYKLKFKSPPKMKRRK